MFRTGPDLERFHAHQRRATAHHEAGHAVAAVARGGTFHGFSIEPTHAYDGGVWCTYDDCHRQFVLFAGPWADARFDWADRPLDAVDDNGLTFFDYLRTSMRCNADDLRKYEPSRDLPRELFEADMFGGEPPEIPLAREDEWYSELEFYWPAMKYVAEKALRGEVPTPQDVQ